MIIWSHMVPPNLGPLNVCIGWVAWSYMVVHGMSCDRVSVLFIVWVSFIVLIPIVIIAIHFDIIYFTPFQTKVTKFFPIKTNKT